MALKDTLDMELHCVSITPDKVIALDSSAWPFYQQVMDSGYQMETFVPPFELLTTALGTSPVDNQVSTEVIGTETKACHHDLLCKAFSYLFTNHP